MSCISSALFDYMVPGLEGLSAFTALGFAGNKSAVVFPNVSMACPALD